MESARPPLEVLVEHFAEAPTLLVLDNLEQVADVAPVLDQLLARCPGLELLATSRTVLRLRAEREYPVGPLTVPAFISSVESLGSERRAAQYIGCGTRSPRLIRQQYPLVRSVAFII